MVRKAHFNADFFFMGGWEDSYREGSTLNEVSRRKVCNSVDWLAPGKEGIQVSHWVDPTPVCLQLIPGLQE